MFIWVAGILLLVMGSIHELLLLEAHAPGGVNTCGKKEGTRDSRAGDGRRKRKVWRPDFMARRKDSQGENEEDK